MPDSNASGNSDIAVAVGIPNAKYSDPTADPGARAAAVESDGPCLTP